MTVPRAMQINFQQTRYYHVVSRCVRRAYLCGFDKLTGRNFDHRKEWLIERVKQLSSIFSIQIASYAILSNHFHLVMYIDTETALTWTDDEVITRWGGLFPGSLAGLFAKCDPVAQEERVVLDAQVPVWRQRLADISWYMKCLNEYIARLANMEDNCKGRYWEGRFRCQALLDDAAVLAAMCYVDLNPIRAVLADTLENSDFTSVQERIETLQPGSTSCKRSTPEVTSENSVSPAPLMPFQSETERETPNNPPPAYFPTLQVKPTLPTTLHHYLALVDWTGRQVRKGKRGRLSDDLAPILSRLGVDEKEWVRTVVDFNKRFRFAAGAIGKLEHGCQAVGRQWIQGRHTAKKLYVQPA